MADSLLPPQERASHPAQARRDLGHALLVIAAQLALIVAAGMIWLGKDLSYSPGRPHSLGCYFLIALGILAALGIAGAVLRRGTPRVG
jgi:hypothetical protein